MCSISIQKPLSDEWFYMPVHYDEPFVRAIDPDYKPFINPIAGRRMGLIMKRAIATSMTALADASLVQPDAIVTATGLGCIENTEKFLKTLCYEGESCLQPTYFINSTHNTIGSSIALHKNAMDTTILTCTKAFLSRVPCSMPCFNSNLAKLKTLSSELMTK